MNSKEVNLPFGYCITITRKMNKLDLYLEKTTKRRNEGLSIAQLITICQI